MTVLVTGAAGQLGATLGTRFASEHRVVALDRAALDITDSDRVVDTIREAAPTVIVNCAAYNDVDGAENDAVGALAVNTFGVRALARAACEVDATLVHYSTDFVFEGTATTPYTEDDRPNPQSVYAMSKLLGEWFAQDARAYVLRLESLFGGAARATPPGAHSRRGSSLDRIADAILEGREVRAFSDRMVSPSYVDDVVTATAALLAAAPPVGIYHCVGSGMATWMEVATQLAQYLGQPARIVPIRMDDQPLKAKRPRFCALSNAKLAGTGIQMPTWQDALRRYAAARRAQVPPATQ